MRILPLVSLPVSLAFSPGMTSFNKASTTQLQATRFPSFPSTGNYNPPNKVVSNVPQTDSQPATTTGTTASSSSFGWRAPPKQAFTTSTSSAQPVAPPAAAATTTTTATTTTSTSSFGWKAPPKKGFTPSTSSSTTTTTTTSSSNASAFGVKPAQTKPQPQQPQQQRNTDIFEFKPQPQHFQHQQQRQIKAQPATPAAPRRVTPSRPTTPSVPTTPTDATATKEDKISRLVSYYKANGQWPSSSYVEPGTGIRLGAFLHRVIDRSVSLTPSQRDAIRNVDPDLFGPKRGGRGVQKQQQKPQNVVYYTTTAAPPAPTTPAKPAVSSIPASSPSVPKTPVAHKATPKVEGLTKDEKIAHLVSYYKSNGQWPAASYVDGESGEALGVFLSRAIDRSVSLTAAQRSALQAVDANVFGKSRGNARVPAAATRPVAPSSAQPVTTTTTSTTTTTTTRPAPVAASRTAPAPISKDDSIARLVAYRKAHGDWPGMSYKDPETGSALGNFLDRVLERQVSLTAAQREKLLAVDPNLFGMKRKGKSAAAKAPAATTAKPSSPVSAAAPSSPSTITTTTVQPTAPSEVPDAVGPYFMKPQSSTPATPVQPSTTTSRRDSRASASVGARRSKKGLHATSDNDRSEIIQLFRNAFTL